MSDDEQNERRAELAAEKRDRLEQALRAVLATRNGRHVFSWLLGQAGTYRTTYSPGDALASAFNEGQRNVGLILEAHLTAVDPESVLKMQREALAEARAERREREGR